MAATNISRRAFLGRAAATAGLSVSAAGYRRVMGANERIGIGIVGAGDRGSFLMGQIIERAASHNVRITAVCDVWRINLERAAERVLSAFGTRASTFTRFADLLACDHVDAVVIATPDFAHGPILIEALRAGKDAYVEKPMTMELNEANEALDIARARQAVVQVGTQYRSHGGYRAAARELSSGTIGKLVRIHASVNFNQPRWARPFGNCRREDVDWDAYLFNRPKRPFDPRLLRRWQLYREFTCGLPGLWMSHYVDAVHLLSGASYPVRAVALGGVYVWKDGRETCDTFRTVLEYPQGFLFDWGMCLANSAGNEFTVFGTDGMLDIGDNYMNPNRLIISSRGGRGGESFERRIEPAAHIDHMGNWLECLRSRQRPVADIEYGHQHSVAAILAAQARDTGKAQQYDPETREIQAAA